MRLNLNKTLKTLCKLLPILMIIACGSSGSNSNSDNSGTSISGIAADGYLRDATVCLDIDNNGRCDEGEPSTTTGDGGAYTLDPGDYDPEAYPLVVEVTAQTVDEDDDQPVGADYTLRAPAGRYGFVTPLTTLIQTKIDQNPALDADAAAQLIGLQLNVEDPDRLYEDYVAGAGDDELDTLHQGAQLVAQAFGEVRSILSAHTEGLEDDFALQAVQVITGKLLLSKLDHVAAAVQEGILAVGDPLDGIMDEAELLDAAEIAKVADQMRVLDGATVTDAYTTLQGKTLYAFEEGGDDNGITIVFFDRFVIDADAAIAWDAELIDMEGNFPYLSEPEETFLETFTVENGAMVFEDQEYISAVSVDLTGLTYKLADLAQVKMQDTELRAEEVTFEAGDLMYKVKGLYPVSDVPALAEDLYNELRDEEEGYSEGNLQDDVITYVATRDVTNPIWDHGVVLGDKVYLKFFEPDSFGSTTGTLKGVLQIGDGLDLLDTIMMGTYEIQELGDGRAYIVMDFAGFAEVNGAFDYLLIVNDSGDDHDHEEIVIGTGAKSAEKTFFNESAMQKIFDLIDENIDYIF
ncbi:MAG: hypothetical protein HY911_05035 [Desulfobacterales bacterium]|nr:hypothetical protein [Desulfobacterales bacterium]